MSSNTDLKSIKNQVSRGNKKKECTEVNENKHLAAYLTNDEFKINCGLNISLSVQVPKLHSGT